MPSQMRSRRVLLFVPGGIDSSMNVKGQGKSLCKALMHRFGAGKVLSKKVLLRHFRRVLKMNNDDGKAFIDFSCMFSENGKEDLPLKLEICSGDGEWAVAQAKADEGVVNWATLELRLSRVHKTFCKSIFCGGAPKGIMGGDARSVLSNVVQPGAVDYIFINHPEPPQQRASGEADLLSPQGAHLLDESFFIVMATALKIGGTLSICSDNAWYSEVLSTLDQLSHLFKDAIPNNVYDNDHGDGDGDGDGDETTVYMQVGQLKIINGPPGRNMGVNAGGASSYFDRMFAKGVSRHSGKTRYTLSVRRA